MGKVSIKTRVDCVYTASVNLEYTYLMNDHFRNQAMNESLFGSTTSTSASTTIDLCTIYISIYIYWRSVNQSPTAFFH